MNILDYRPPKDTPLIFDDPTEECLCGSETFWVACRFYESEIAGYFTDMSCVECGARYKTPTPEDEDE